MKVLNLLCRTMHAWHQQSIKTTGMHCSGTAPPGALLTSLESTVALKVTPCAMRYATIFYASCAMCYVLCDDFQWVHVGPHWSPEVLVLRAAGSSQVWCRSICACDVCTAFIPGEVFLFSVRCDAKQEHPLEAKIQAVNSTRYADDLLNHRA